MIFPGPDSPFPNGPDSPFPNGPDSPFPNRPDSPFPNGPDSPIIPKSSKDNSILSSPRSTTKYSEEVEEQSTKSPAQTTSEKLYMILGCVLGMMMLLLIVFMFMCWYKQRQQRRMMGKNPSSEFLSFIYVLFLCMCFSTSNLCHFLDKFTRVQIWYFLYHPQTVFMGIYCFHVVCTFVLRYVLGSSYLAK